MIDGSSDRSELNKQRGSVNTLKTTEKMKKKIEEEHDLLSLPGFLVLLDSRVLLLFHHLQVEVDEKPDRAANAPHNREKEAGQQRTELQKMNETEEE